MPRTSGHASVFLVLPLVFLGSLAPAATLSIGTAQVRPKEAGIEVAMTFAAEAGEQVSGIQFDLLFSENVAALSAMRTGAAAAAAGKSVSFNQIAAGRYRALVAGLNQNIIGDGVVVVLVFDVGAAPPNGLQPLDLDGLIMSDPNGFRVPATGISGVLDVVGGVPDWGNCPNCGCACGVLGQGPAGPRGNMLVCVAVLLATAARAALPRLRRSSAHEG